MATIITVNIQKGGVGKTTTAHELASNLSEMGFRVLAIDLDQQQNLSAIAGAALVGYYNIYDLLKGDCAFMDCVQTGKHYDIAVAGKKLAEAEKEFSNWDDVYRLDIALKENKVKERYDYIIIDTPPNLGILPSMALSASDYVLIPVEASSSGAQGLGQLYERIEKVRHPQRGTNKDLKIAGMLLTMFNDRTKFTQHIRSQLEEVAENMQTKIFKTFIRPAVVVKESQGWRESLTSYDPKSKPALDYKTLTLELLENIKEGMKNHG